jgi:lipoyl(octanoyl) transferase
MPKRILEVCRLGRIDYETALKIQKETETAVIAREKNDTLFLLEHPHTFTLGRRAKMDGVLATGEILKTLGATVFETDRGGKVTYHGLGQIVGYPIINLSLFKEDVHLYVRNLEEVLIRTMTDFEIEPFRIKDLTGVHTSDGKIAAIGVHIKRWVTTHGFALNVNTDLSFFDWIIACEGEPVTSMEKLLGREPGFREVENQIIKNFAGVFEYAEIVETANQVRTNYGSQ